MKKLIILFVALFALSASAQSVRLIYQGRMLNLNDTIDVAAVQGEQTNVRIFSLRRALPSQAAEASL